jgi:hypothetical protein
MRGWLALNKGPAREYPETSREFLSALMFPIRKIAGPRRTFTRLLAQRSNIRSARTLRCEASRGGCDCRRVARGDRVEE